MPQRTGEAFVKTFSQAGHAWFCSGRFLPPLTVAEWNFPSLFISRLLFGAGESGCFPGLASVFRTWLPRRERNSAEGIKAACVRWGAAIVPALMTGLYTWFTWRQVFVLPGLAGAGIGLISCAGTGTIHARIHL